MILCLAKRGNSGIILLLIDSNNRSMLDAYPSLQNMYSADDGNTEVFYFKNATATFSSFTHEPEVIKR